ncbi:MAG: ABC transporter ATP-binding protein [Bacteroidota bacterium]|nr:ABC transporter ATP-binding protein [Bacteroidota bacterium]
MKSVIVKNLEKKYGEVKAIENINFEIDSGELFGLIGPDGAGKTTIFRIITSLLTPSSGKATLNNLDSVDDYKEVRKIIGYMPGRFSLYQDLTVEENLDFFASIFNTTVEQNYNLIKDIYEHLEPFKKRLAGRLSGGMKQKLALSCALIHAPEILILDEPTTGVDAVSRKEFWEMLKKLKTKGITIIVSTPYMDEASMCDRVALIQKGKILNINTPQNIIKSFEHKLFAVNSDKKQNLINDLRNFEHMNSAYAFGDSIHYTDKRNDFSEKDLEIYLASKNHSNISIKLIKANIEDCFMEYMTK